MLLNLLVIPHNFTHVTWLASHRRENTKSGAVSIYPAAFVAQAVESRTRSKKRKTQSLKKSHFLLSFANVPLLKSLSALLGNRITRFKSNAGKKKIKRSTDVGGRGVARRKGFVGKGGGAEMGGPRQWRES